MKNGKKIEHWRGPIPGRKLYDINDIAKNFETKHCCFWMTQFIYDKRIPINYSLVYRHYFIYLLLGSSGIQIIEYCPWCGIKFAPSLVTQYFSILEKEFNLDFLDVEEAEEKGLLPEEFKTDEWWKKRGL